MFISLPATVAKYTTCFLGLSFTGYSPLQRGRHGDCNGLDGGGGSLQCTLFTPQQIKQQKMGRETGLEYNLQGLYPVAYISQRCPMPLGFHNLPKQYHQMGQRAHIHEPVMDILYPSTTLINSDPCVLTLADMPL